MEVEENATAGRPTVWLNCAASLDGRLAYAGGVRARLSSPEDLARVHRLRAGVDGIVVGVGTVVLDDPSLRVREELLDRPIAHRPWRIVVDASGRTPPAARLLDGSSPTLVLTTEENRRSYPEPVRTVVAGRGHVDLARGFEELGRRGLGRLLVEGGAALFASVVRARLFDRWTIYYAPVVIGGATAPPIVAGAEARGPNDAVGVRLASIERLGDGCLATYVPAAPARGP